MFGFGFGLKVYEDVSLGERRQVMFPKSKKKRIRRKWAKNPKYFKFIPDPNIYRVGNMILGHPETLAVLKRELASENSRRNVRI